MKIDTKYRPELCASKDTSRMGICEPYLEGSKLIATDGKMIVIIPVERGSDTSNRYVSKDFLVESRRGPLAGEVMRDGEHETLMTRTGAWLRRKLHLSTFPHWQNVIPDYKESFSICLNAELLSTVAKALGAKSGVRLTFRLEAGKVVTSAPIRVAALDDNLAEGYLMPMRDL